MFGFSLATQLFQGSAQRTWNCVTQFTNLLWYKFNHIRHPIMPRSRRRHHSRSRSRSRSHSHDRDREAKRRKIDSVESPTHKRSVSCEPQSPTATRRNEEQENLSMTLDETVNNVGQESRNEIDDREKIETRKEEAEEEGSADLKDANHDNLMTEEVRTENKEQTYVSDENVTTEMGEKEETEENKQVISDEKKEQPTESSEDSDIKSENQESSEMTEKSEICVQVEQKEEKPTSSESTAKQQLEEKLTITPKKAMSPKQLQKKLESEQKRKQKQLEREERERKRQEEKERLRLEKQRQKQEKEEQKQKERELKEEQKRREREEKEEQKRKEREEKEAKRKEKEEREEQKRREREQEKQRKQQEIEEKNKEKQKIEEQKQKAAAAFVNFFVTKKPETGSGSNKTEEEKTSSKFMPFQVKSDMRLAPLSRRPVLSEEEKKSLCDFLAQNDDNASYLLDLKRQDKEIRKYGKTWPVDEEEDDDVIMVTEDFGESICEDKSKSKKMRVKFLLFHENRRPPYYGTWRKRSGSVKPRKPFAEDKVYFDYEVDSDDDWEEEEQGESLNGSDDEDKENEAENDDYEVDNDFFVPHGHLSEDEMDDEATAKLSPESHKQKLKLLKDEFDEDMKAKTHKIKPRSIGCVWYNKDGSNVDEAIDRHLKPLAIITSNGPIVVKKRRDLMTSTTNTPTSSRKYAKELKQELIPAFLKLIHGNVNKRTTVVDDFISYMQNNGYVVEVSKAYLQKRVKDFAQWKKCPTLNKFCWCVEEETRKKYNI